MSVLAELKSSIQEEKVKANQTKEIRNEFHSTLANIEEWLNKAALATSHHKDDTSDKTSQAILVNIGNVVENVS